VLDVALDELAGARAQDVGAREVGAGQAQAITSWSWSRKPNAPPGW
jgi:hypothetical protein